MFWRSFCLDLLLLRVAFSEVSYHLGRIRRGGVVVVEVYGRLFRSRHRCDIPGRMPHHGSLLELCILSIIAPINVPQLVVYLPALWLAASLASSLL